MNAWMRKLPLMRSCKEASALVIAREDRALLPHERWALRLHLAMCRACPGFEAQVLGMRQALSRWRHYNEEDEKEDGDLDKGR
jgi:hypothetical protein